MPRNLSFALTTQQFIDGTKTVTRRDGWEFLKAGDILCAVEKSQGLGKGGKIKRLDLIEVVDVRREILCRLTNHLDYGRDEVQREGFPDWTPEAFVEFFCRSHKNMTPRSVVTRIEFKRLHKSSW